MARVAAIRSTAARSAVARTLCPWQFRCSLHRGVTVARSHVARLARGTSLARSTVASRGTPRCGTRHRGTLSRGTLRLWHCRSMLHCVVLWDVPPWRHRGSLHRGNLTNAHACIRYALTLIMHAEPTTWSVLPGRHLIFLSCTRVTNMACNKITKHAFDMLWHSTCTWNQQRGACCRDGI